MTRAARALLLAVALASGLHGAAAAQGRPFAKVAVAESGAVTLDGRPVSLPELRAELETLAKWKGEVWYYRANPAAEPPPAALAVIEAVMQARLPVRFATKPDFSAFDGDAIEPGDDAPPPPAP